METVNGSNKFLKTYIPPIEKKLKSVAGNMKLLETTGSKRDEKIENI